MSSVPLNYLQALKCDDDSPSGLYYDFTGVTDGTVWKQPDGTCVWADLSQEATATSSPAVNMSNPQSSCVSCQGKSCCHSAPCCFSTNSRVIVNYSQQDNGSTFNWGADPCCTPHYSYTGVANYRDYARWRTFVTGGPGIPGSTSVTAEYAGGVWGFGVPPDADCAGNHHCNAQFPEPDVIVEVEQDDCCGYVATIHHVDATTGVDWQENIDIQVIANHCCEVAGGASCAERNPDCNGDCPA